MERFIYFVLVCALVGTHASPIQERISNGIIASDTNFPFAVSIQLATAANLVLETRGHMCGGVLITVQHVLTAGSCTYTWGTGNTIIPIVANQYRVFAGARSLTSDTTDRVRAVANYTLHPDHLPAPAQLNDIAIMTLVSPFNATIVPPLTLPPINFAPADSTHCTVAGWGSPQYSANTSSQLLYMNKYIYNQDLCRTFYNAQPGIPNIFTSMVCAASFDMQSSGCNGDRGNALVCNGILTGISFFTADCQATHYPELYTRVSNYTSWIRSITGAASTFKPGLFTLTLFTIIHAAFQKVLA